MGYPTADRNSFLTSQVTGTLYIALYTVAPDDDGTGGTECAYTGYTRIAHSAWTTAASGNRANDGSVTFPKCTGAADSETIVAATVMTALTGGTQKGVTDTFTGGTVTENVQPSFASGELDFNFT